MKSSTKSSIKEAFNFTAMYIGGATTFVFGNGFVSELLGHHPMGTDMTLPCLAMTVACAGISYLGYRNHRKSANPDNKNKTPQP